MTNDKQSAQLLSDLQRKLLPITTYGRVLQEQSQEVQTAIKDLQALGKEVTQEKLLDLICRAPNDIRLSVLVSVARQVMDYTFFQLLSERIDKEKGDEKNRLVELRGKLLEMTQEIDRQMEQRIRQIYDALEDIQKSENIQEALAKYLPLVDELFMQELDKELKRARSQGDLERSAKLNQIVEIVEQLNELPGAALLEEYLDAADDEARLAFLESNDELVTQEFLDMLAGLVSQVQSAEDPELKERVAAANRLAIRYMMRKNLRSS